MILPALRFTTAGIVLLPLAYRKGLRIGPAGLYSSFLLAFLMGAGYITIAAMGMKMASASHAGTLINGSVLLVTTLVGVAVMREPFSVIRLLGILTSVIGILLILAAKPAESNFFPHQWLGHILFIIAGCMWGSYILLARQWRLDALHATIVVNVFSMLCYMPFYLAFAPGPLPALTFAVVLQALYQGILTAIIAFLFFNKGIMLVGGLTRKRFCPVGACLIHPACHTGIKRNSLHMGMGRSIHRIVRGIAGVRRYRCSYGTAATALAPPS